MTFHPTSCGFLLSIPPICQEDNHVPSKAMEDPFYVLIFLLFFFFITLKGKKKKNSTALYSIVCSVSTELISK